MRDCFYLRQLKKLDLQQSNRYNSFDNLEYRRASIKHSGAHCMKSVQIRSFFWSSFSCIRTEYGREKNLYLDTFSRSGLFNFWYAWPGNYSRRRLWRKMSFLKEVQLGFFVYVFHGHKLCFIDLLRWIIS